MQPVVSKSPHPLVWMVGISVIVFSLLGTPALMGWIPASFGGAPDTTRLVGQPTAPTQSSAQNAPKTPGQVAGSAVTKTSCIDCGVIAAMRVIDTPGETSVIGVIGGAVVGGALGNQIGGGRGKDIATVVGAVGGAVAGTEIEKRVRSTKTYETTVRFENGSTREFAYATPPQWNTGDRIRVVDGVIHPRG